MQICAIDGASRNAPMRFVRFTALVLASYVAFGLLAGRALAQKPNIIMLFSDDAGYADFGFMNQVTGLTSKIRTPNLDALAAQSMVMSNAYVSSSVCAVSRAGLLTGRYQERFGMDYNIANTNDPNDGIPTNEFLLTEAMKQAGYSTGVFGKWHVGAEPAKQPNNQGVDYFYGVLAGGRPYFAPGGVNVLRNNAPIQWQNEASFNNIAPDPVLGREFTDSIDDEASQYIAQHANQANPFFMYVPFTAPHEPFDQAKQQDLAQYDDSGLTGDRKDVAALMTSLDRAVGNIMTRLTDPNGDGNTSDSVANNTIIVFANDNGGQAPDSTTQNQIVQDNGNLRGYKGQGWEGGIRTPMLIHLPGGPTGVFDQPVTTLDMMPTFLAAAGAPLPANLDGKNLLPYLEGQQTGVIHDTLFWRGGQSYWAMRQGDWKLVHGGLTAGVQLYHLNPDGTGELTSYNTTEPALFNSMLKQFVDWEATLAKPTQTALRFTNRFDAFRFKTDSGTNVKWRDANVWQNDDNPAVVTSMQREDPYANAVLVFQPRNDASYVANNNITRSTGYYEGNIDAGILSPPGLIEFMMNELRLNGSFSGAANQSATLTGFPLMFVKNLSGGGPKITLDATSTTANTFAYNVNMDIVLHDSLEITGNGTQPLTINGQIRDFNGPNALTKTGSSIVKLAGNNTYFGNTIVSGGVLQIDGPNAALANTAKVSVGAQSSLVLASGRIHTPVVEIASGGTFQFNGGILETAQVIGSLTNNGGDFRPGLSIAKTTISGDFTQNAGQLSIELGGTTAGTQFDQLLVSGTAAISGSLTVTLANLGGGLFSPALGSTFEIIHANSLSGAFSSISAPTLSGGRKWAVQNTTNSVLLQVVSGLAADFDHNNAVNAADLLIWKNSLGVNALGDANGDGVTDPADFLVWQRQVGMQLLSSSGALAQVPEPGSAVIAAAAILTAGAFRSRERASTPRRKGG